MAKNQDCQNFKLIKINKNQFEQVKSWLTN